MPNPKSITSSEAIRQVAAQLDGPIAQDEFTARVLEIWPSNAKDPHANLRTSIRQSHLGVDLLYLDDETLLPVRLATQGLRFRVPLTRREAEHGLLNYSPAFLHMHPRALPPDQFRFEDPGGNELPSVLRTDKVREQTLFGVQEIKTTSFEFAGWFEKNGVRRNDHMLITVLDWETGRFRLQPEPAKVYEKQRAEIQARNQALADLVYDLLEDAKWEHVRATVAVPTAYLRLKDPAAPPPDHWLKILEEDGRMAWAGYDIRYAEWGASMVDFFFDDPREPVREPVHVSKQQAARVYRFKAFLQYRKGLWRKIEIQGGQTLDDFDGILRTAFEHDHSDHLSGFWKLVRRGNSRRFREVDLGTINPFEKDGAGATRIAELDLGPGDQLKYIYDFGDWVEHRIELEETADPEPDAEYPRIIAENKPRYKYCESCKGKGRKTVATWICIVCSNDEQRNVLVCEDCLDEHHEDHYADEVLY